MVQRDISRRKPKARVDSAPSDGHPENMTTPEAAAYMRFSKGTLRSLSAPNGPIPVVRLSRRRILYRRRDLDLYLASRTVEAGAEQ